MSEWVEVTYPVEMGGYYEDGFWADSNTVQQVVSAAANHATAIENARIIKLLEESVKTTGISLDADSNFYQGLKQAIELIKRKTK